MLKYFTSVFFLLWSWVVMTQDTPVADQKDSVEYKQIYGIRVGVDLSRPLRSFLEDNYQGFEIMGDLRITYRLFLAAELGNEKRSRAEELGSDTNSNQFDIYDYESSGSYLKFGVDFNTYENWYGMNNSIYIGGRYAVSTFSQTLNNYRIYDSNRYWSPDGFVEGTMAPEEFSGLNASWIEFVFGIKAELFKNLFAGGSVRLSFLVTNKESDRMRNLWIPGFNKVTEDSSFGVGYNFSLTYLIPIYKKKNIKKDKSED